MRQQRERNVAPRGRARAWAVVQLQSPRGIERNVARENVTRVSRVVGEHEILRRPGIACERTEPGGDRLRPIERIELFQ